MSEPIKVREQIFPGLPIALWIDEAMPADEAVLGCLNLSLNKSEKVEAMRIINLC